MLETPKGKQSFLKSTLLPFDGLEAAHGSCAPFCESDENHKEFEGFLPPALYAGVPGEERSWSIRACAKSLQNLRKSNGFGWHAQNHWKT